MSSIFFWRKKREEESAVQSTVEAQAAASTESSPELVPASLPVRSSRKGIRSLFSFAKFDSNDLQSLEEILIQADFGLAASEKIVALVKQQAKSQGASTEAQLREILAQVIESELAVSDR